MKKLLLILIIIVTGCSTPEPEPTCNCYKMIYFQHGGNPLQYLFHENAQMSDCDNWIIGDDVKTDDNGYLYNYLKVCE